MMEHRVQFGIRGPDGQIVGTAPTLPKARDKAGETPGGRVVIRVVMLGTWGPPGGRCPVHFLTHCAKCGWVA